MLKVMKKLINRETVLYVLFGVLTTAVDWVSYTLLRWMGTDYRIATAISWAAAVLFAFVTNKLFVFGSRELGLACLCREFAGFVAARAATGVFTVAGMVVTVDFLHWNEYFGKAVVSVLSLAMNYVFSKWFIFRKKPDMTVSKTEE